MRGGEAFTSDTGMFVNNYTQTALTATNFFGLDFDATATTLYAVDNTALGIFTIDPVTGIETATGQTATLPGLTGLTASPDGSTWYASDFDGVNSVLFVGDITTGVFTTVGTIGATIIIDISMDSTGNLYGFSITDDSLYSIDTTTGLGTVIGLGVGLNANFAQGMDFDWSSDTLYATIYTGGGTGMFCSLDLVTGVANMLEDTTSLNAEMEMAVQVGVGAPIGTNYCMANPNTTGSIGMISAVGSLSVAANNVTLTADSLPNNSFGFFITSQMTGFVANPNGSAGNLCVLGAIGRYVGAGQIQTSGSAGEFSLALDLTQTPTPTGLVSIMALESWNFQAWYRDGGPMGPTSNFTDGLTILFQ